MKDVCIDDVLVRAEDRVRLYTNAVLLLAPGFAGEFTRAQVHSRQSTLATRRSPAAFQHVKLSLPLLGTNTKGSRLRRNDRRHLRLPVDLMLDAK